MKVWLFWLAGLACAAVPPVAAQEPMAPAPTPEPMVAAASPAPSPSATAGLLTSELAEVAPPEEVFALKFGNRPIVVFRSRVLGRTPEERATAVVRRLDDLAGQRLTGPVEWRKVGGLAVVTVAGREAVTILPTDADPLSGETLEGVARQAVVDLTRAMSEVVEARSPDLLLRAALRVIAATVAAVLLAACLLWVRRRLVRHVPGWLEAHLVRPLERRARGDIWRTAEARLAALIHLLGRLLFAALSLALLYAWLTFVLRQFPYTRPWGEALRGFVLATVLGLGRGMLAAIPGLFTVVLIVFFTRLAIRVVNALFRAVEEGRLALPGVYPDTAQPTRRLTVVLLWLFAVVVAYPYLPGSGTDAFKGVSVFVGLMVSLGSSGLVNQAMSSFMITYSRALRLGDYVRIGEVEGTVVHTGLLATKVRTRRNEEVTFPNAAVASTTITNFSRHSGEGVYARTSITIGYDTPWRQVEAMLLVAASRTTGAQSEPPPRVLQTALQDFYVEYTLIVVPERPEDRVRLLSELHGHIQDAFNENGVQIMSPHYETDPAGPKVVPRDRWFDPPARPQPRE
jgi:small-conductance mechanosensitive channel